MNIFDLQKFAENKLEAIQGKRIIYLFRVAGDSAKEDATVVAFQTEGERDIQKDADSTATKSGSIRTPSVAEIEITNTSVLAKGDKLIDKLEEAMLSNQLIECWEVNLDEPGTGVEANKYKAKYYQGYITELDITVNAEDAAEVEITYGANGNGASGYATVSDDQKEIASYVFKDVVKEAE